MSSDSRGRGMTLSCLRQVDFDITNSVGTVPSEFTHRTINTRSVQNSYRLLSDIPSRNESIPLIIETLVP